MLGFFVMLALSTFLIATAGDYWPWYAFMAFLLVAPLVFGPRWLRVAAACALSLSAFLIVSDYRAGKIWNAHRRDLIRKAKHDKSPVQTPASSTPAADAQVAPSVGSGPS
jgi:hypothetical protein